MNLKLHKPWSNSLTQVYTYVYYHAEVCCFICVCMSEDDTRKEISWSLIFLHGYRVDLQLQYRLCKDKVRGYLQFVEIISALFVGLRICPAEGKAFLI